MGPSEASPTGDAPVGGPRLYNRPCYHVAVLVHLRTPRSDPISKGSRLSIRVGGRHLIGAGVDIGVGNGGSDVPWCRMD